MFKKGDKVFIISSSAYKKIFTIKQVHSTPNRGLKYSLEGEAGEFFSRQLLPAVLANPSCFKQNNSK